jgi:uncharacterized integral membrane protein
MKRLFLFILIFAVFLAYIVLNLKNTCDISFGFVTFKYVPVFLSSLSSFMLGLLFVFPVSIVLSHKKNRKPKTPKKEKQPLEQPSGNNEFINESGPYGIN